MSDLSREEEVEQQFHHLFQTGAYSLATELATREAHIFPEYAQKVIFSWRMNCACRLEDKKLVLLLLNEAVQAGYWYSHLKDGDFNLLHGDPEFERKLPEALDFVLPRS